MFDLIRRNTYDIKTAFLIRRMVFQKKILRTSCDRPLLPDADGLKRRPVSSVPAVFDLAEHQSISVLCDNIDLSETAPVIILYDPVTLFLQKMSCRTL